MAATYETLERDLECAYFEDLVSADNPVLDMVLPNEPIWGESSPRMLLGPEALGESILENNEEHFIAGLEKYGADASRWQVPSYVQSLLGLEDSELAEFFGTDPELLSDFAKGQSRKDLLRSLLTAKFVHDTLVRQRPGHYGVILRIPSELYAGRNMIQAIGEGRAAFVVGNLYQYNRRLDAII